MILISQKQKRIGLLELCRPMDESPSQLQAAVDRKLQTYAPLNSDILRQAGQWKSCLGWWEYMASSKYQYLLLSSNFSQSSTPSPSPPTPTGCRASPAKPSSQAATPPPPPSPFASHVPQTSAATTLLGCRPASLDARRGAWKLTTSSDQLKSARAAQPLRQQRAYHWQRWRDQSQSESWQIVCNHMNP